MTELRQARLIVSGDALLTVPEAASLVGGRGAREWLESHVRIRVLAGRRLVLWGDVIRASERTTEGAAAPQPPPRRPKLRLADP